MIENLFFMNGFGLYVWSAFTFTLVSFLTLFLVIKIQYNKEKNNMIFHVNTLIDTSSIYESEDNFLPEDYNSHQDLKRKPEHSF